MAYTGPFPHNNTATITAIVVSHTSFSGVVGNTGIITPGGITVTDSTINGSILDTGGAIGGAISVDGSSKITSTTQGISDVEGVHLGGITNAGVITADEAGIFLESVGTFSGGLSNSGTITGNTWAIFITGGSTFSAGLNNSGTINGDSKGIVVNVHDFSGGLNNTGTINVSGTGAGIKLLGGSNFSGGVSNGGIINGGDQGIDVSGYVSFTGDLSNSSLIKATKTGVVVEGVGAFFGVISNSGAISVSGVAGTGIDVASLVDVINSGAISASGTGIEVTSAQEIAIFNSGTITSSGDAIDFDNAGAGVVNTLVLEPGYSIAGKVVGTGSDVLSLGPRGGSGSGTFNLSKIGTAFTGFTVFNVVGATWMLSGVGFESWNIGGGVLELGSGCSIDNNVTFTENMATLRFDTGTNQLTGDIARAVAGDNIDLGFIAFAAGDNVVWQQSGGTGTLSLLNSSGTALATLNLSGQYTTADFNVVTDGRGGTVIELVNPAPPAGTTADMVMTNSDSDDYEIYDIGGNAVLAAYSLGQIANSLTFVGLGDLNGADTSDILLRNTSTGAFQADYVNSNTITNTVQVGTVGLNWNFAGTGDFDGASSLSELLLRNSGSGSFELYEVASGGVLSGSSVAAVGNNLQVSGFGNFSGSSTTQMIMEQANEAPGTNAYWLYSYNPSAAAFAGHIGGTVGNNLSVVGFGDLLSNGETQMVMQQNNGNFWLYSYQPSTNSLSGTLVGAIGSNFHVVGFGPLGTSGQDEMLMQDAAGDFEVYQYSASENAFVGTSMGAVGAPWVVDGIAANPSSGGASAASTAQLTQAMASFGTTAAANSAPVPALGTAEQTQQTLLTTPHA